jgi:hypothetical protein
MILRRLNDGVQNYPEKGDLWWDSTAAEEYKRNLKKE